MSHQAFLTYLDKNEPFVYLQLLPDCEKTLEKINEFINEIVEKNQHKSSYEIGDHVVARFTDDSNYYRAQIRSYSSETQLYTVFFLDYGNQDDNVAETEIFSYTNELEKIEAQAHRYRLEKIDSSMWINTVRSMIEEQNLNDQVEFDWIDEENNLIHIKFADEEKIYQSTLVMPQTASGNISAFNQDCFFIHLLPDADSLICEMDELIQNLVKEHRDENERWSLDDLCIVFDPKENRSFRGRILQDHGDSTFDVQCIDYGNILTHIKTDHLYILNDEEVKNRSPLARKCRLFGVNDENQIKAIDEVIQFISPTELVTITIQNDPNASCLLVMLFREDHQIVNDQYQIDSEIRQDLECKDKPAASKSDNTSDSAIAADDDSSQAEVNPVLPQAGETHLTSPIGIPQAESTHQYGDTSNMTMTMNQTIDFGENDPSSSTTTLKGVDETDELD